MNKPTARFLILTVFLLSITHSFAQVEVIQGAESNELEFLGRTGELRYKRTTRPTNTNSNSRNTSVFPLLTIDGIDVTDAPNTIVPDANGDVSPEHYIQVTNGETGSLFQLFDKSGTMLYGPESLNAFWQSFNIIGLGEPIVLWDQEAERWLISEKGGLGTNTLLVAISMTSDPLGDWYAYQLQAPEIPNFPKYSIWSNAYYLTTKEEAATPSTPDIPIYVLDRAAMLNGEPASAQRVSIPKFDNISPNVLQVATPADWDGAISPPPADSPLCILRMYDNDWAGGIGQDKLEIWEVEVDWSDANNTTVSGPIILYTESFESDVCDGNIFNCLTQSNGVGISPQMEVIMHRVNYRNFGDHETMVLNHVVDVDGNNLAGVKWYELRKTPGSSWTIYQEGVVSFDDHHRFLGSIAIDAAGNIGLGYSVMGADKELSLAFTGRKASDPINQMTIDEYEFATGESAFDGFRWGDYAMMSVDETDGRTFWFTGEYMKDNGQWGTKITAFQVNRDSVDIGPVKIINPVNSPYLTDLETVEVQLKNFGIKPQANFKIGLIVDDVLLADDVVTDTIQPDSVFNIALGDPVNMDALGTYDFKVYTYLPNDQNPFNDTLRKSISRMIRLDAGITGFTKIENLVCDTFAEMGIILTNLGPDTLWTSEVKWSYNTGPQEYFNWSGTLAMNESDTINVLLNPLLDGSNTLMAGTSNPNGDLDENMENDLLERAFDVEIAGEKIALHLQTDLHPAETTWALTDEFGMLLYEGGPYTAPYTEYIESLCLVEGCYTFTIFDSWVDGLTAGSPDGAYYLSDENGKILATIIDTAFVDSEVNTFCIPFVCALSSEAVSLVESESGADDGVINITASNGIPPYQYSIDNGMSYYDDSSFTGLSGNIYNVIVKDVNGCTSEMEVPVITCTLQFTVVATNATEGQENGSIEVNLPENGIPPYRYSANNGALFQSSNVFNGLPSDNYLVMVEDSLGCISVLEVPVNITVRVNEALNDSRIKVSPNPSDGPFQIDVLGLNDVQTLDIELLDVSGKIIQYHQLSQYNDKLTGTLSLHQFPAGVYFVRFKHESIPRLTKLIKR